MQRVASPTLLQSLVDEDLKSILEHDELAFEKFVELRTRIVGSPDIAPAAPGAWDKGILMDKIDGAFVQCFMHKVKGRNVLQDDFLASPSKDRKQWQCYYDMCLQFITEAQTSGTQGTFPKHLISRCRTALFWHPDATRMPWPLLSSSFVLSLPAHFEKAPFALREVSYPISVIVSYLCSFYYCQ